MVVRRGLSYCDLFTGRYDLDGGGGGNYALLLKLIHGMLKIELLVLSRNAAVRIIKEDSLSLAVRNIYTYLIVV